MKRCPWLLPRLKRSLFLAVLGLASPAAAEDLPALLVLTIEEIGKRVDDASYYVRIMRQQAPTQGSAGAVGAGAPTPAKRRGRPANSTQNFLDDFQAMRRRFQRDGQKMKRRFQLDQQQMAQAFKEQLREQRRRFRKTYARWRSHRPGYRRDIETFKRNTIDLDRFKISDREEAAAERKAQQAKDAEVRRRSREVLQRRRKAREAKRKAEAAKALQEEKRLKRQLAKRRDREAKKRLRAYREKQLEARRQKAAEEAKIRAEEERRLKESLRRYEQDKKKKQKHEKKVTKPKWTWKVVKGALDHPVRHQAARPTCAAFAGIRAIEIKRAQRHAPVDLSEQYFYWSSKPDCQQRPCKTWGSWSLFGLRNSKRSARPDIPEESDCPYNPRGRRNNQTQVPLRSSCHRKGKAQVVDYHVVRNVDALPALLDQDHPIIGGFTLSPAFYKTKALLTVADDARVGRTDRHAGGHGFNLVGYLELPKAMHATEGKRCFIAANSWGMGWGAGGHSCISEAWLKKHKGGNGFIAITGVR